MGSLKFKGLFKELFPKTLFKRTLLIIGLPLVLVQIVFTVVFLDRYLDSVTKNLASNLAGITQLVTDMYNKNRDQALTIASELGLDVSFLEGAELKNMSPTLIQGWEDRYLDKALKHRLQYPFALTSTNDELTINVEMEQGVVVLSVSRKRLMSRATPLLFVWVFGSSLFFLIIASIFLRNQVRPIQKLAVAADKFGRGEDEAIFKIAGAQEVRQAGKAFTLMKERIKRQIEQRTTMLAGISHDLRTPLTRIKLQLEMLPRSKAKEGICLDVAEMEALIEEYLSFVKGTQGEKSASVDLQVLIMECLVSMKNMPLDVRADVPSGFLLPLKPNSFKRALWNLLSNANRYASSAILRVRKDESGILITLEDNGTGIPVEKRQDVFKPFYRLESSRNPGTGGTGLGLSIAQDVVHNHGGTIELGASSLGGLKVSICLPA